MREQDVNSVEPSSESQRTVRSADTLGYTDPEHYIWSSNQHHKFDPTKPPEKWDTDWRALRAAVGLPGFRWH